VLRTKKNFFGQKNEERSKEENLTAEKNFSAKRDEIRRKKNVFKMNTKEEPESWSRVEPFKE
jgi:hypothetical protein